MDQPSTHLFIGSNDRAVPTGDCVTMGSHKANFQYAQDFLTSASIALDSDGIILQYHDDPRQTVANLTINGKIVLAFLFR